MKIEETHFYCDSVKAIPLKRILDSVVTMYIFRGIN